MSKPKDEEFDRRMQAAAMVNGFLGALFGFERNFVEEAAQTDDAGREEMLREMSAALREKPDGSGS